MIIWRRNPGVERILTNADFDGDDMLGARAHDFGLDERGEQSLGGVKVT